MVGFNRRFAPLTVLLKEKIGNGPMAMICRVNAGRVPKDSWIQDKERGGGRIVGEVCHFVDYLTFLNGSLPRRVFAAVLKDFKELSVYGDGRPYNKKLLSQDKGQMEMVRAFVGAVRDGGLAPMPFDDICAVTLATFKVLESLRTGRAVDLKP